MGNRAIGEENDGERAPLPPVVPTGDPDGDGLHSLPVSKHAFFAELYAPTTQRTDAGPQAPAVSEIVAVPEQSVESVAEPLWQDRRDDWVSASEASHRDQHGSEGVLASGQGALGDPSISLALSGIPPTRAGRKMVVPALIAVVAIAVAGVFASVVLGAKDDAGQSDQMDGGQMHSPASAAAVQGRDADELRSLIPDGFPEGSCLTVAPGAAGVLAQIECGRYGGVGGPDRAVYQRADDSARLAELLQSAQDASIVRVCPGRIQSPGPWRRGGAPQQVGGIVFCAQRTSESVMGWTDDEQKVFALISSGRGGSSPEQLYRWWSAHS